MRSASGRSLVAVLALALAGCPGSGGAPASPPAWEQRMRVAQRGEVQIPTLEPVRVGVSDIDQTGVATITVRDEAQEFAQGTLRQGERLRFAAGGRVYDVLVREYELHLTHDDIAHLTIERLPEGTPAPVAPVATSAGPAPEPEGLGPGEVLPPDTPAPGG